MKIFRDWFSDDFHPELLSILIIVAIAALIFAGIQHDQYYSDKCEAAGGMLITANDSHYVCIHKDSVIKL